MSPFWQNVELLPSAVREKARKKPRSKEEYEKTREKVKEGVQEAKEHREQNEDIADVMLYIEFNEEELKEKMKEENLQDIAGEIRSYDSRKWGQMQAAFGEGKFDLQVDKVQGKPQISMTIDLPEGNVAETLSLNQNLQDALMTQALGKKE